jgi:hypothetical protein
MDSVKVPGRPPHGWREGTREARTVAAVQWLREQGWEEIDACRCAAKALAKVGIKGRRGDDLSPDTVRGWLDKVKGTDEIYRNSMTNLTMVDTFAPDLTKSGKARFIEQFLQLGEYRTD